MSYFIEFVHSVRVCMKDWTRQYPDITFVEVDLEYVNEDDQMIRETLTMDIEDWWIIEEYGYFTSEY